MGDKKQERCGSILSIDFKNAFCSVKLHWYDLIMKKIGFPPDFVDWFWNLYNNLNIIINMNGIRSAEISNGRGFLEGHPPSMLAYVISTIPFIRAHESKFVGIKVENRIFKLRSYADDLKLFLNKPEEIGGINEIITLFEQVSGTQLHRDPKLKKCNVLNFGSHRNFNFPSWVNKTDKIKIIGGLFSNNSDIIELNSTLAKNNVKGKLVENWGMQGTLFQKVYFINTFCLTKLNYIAQVFEISGKHCEELKKFILKFLYVGENERPVQILNFRQRKDGGLGLVHPLIKSKALLIKNVFRDFTERKLHIVNGVVSEELYGIDKEFYDLANSGKLDISSKEIYDSMLFKFVRNNNSLIPSRMERKSCGIKWSRAHKNLYRLGGMTACEKEFGYKLQQDLLLVNARNFRRKDKTCKRNLGSNKLCLADQDRAHYFVHCEYVKSSFNKLKYTLKEFSGKMFNDQEIIHLGCSVSNKKKTRILSWLIVKFLFKIFKGGIKDYIYIFKGILRDIKFLVEWNIYSGSVDELKDLTNIITDICEN